MDGFEEPVFKKTYMFIQKSYENFQSSYLNDFHRVQNALYDWVWKSEDTRFWNDSTLINVNINALRRSINTLLIIRTYQNKTFHRIVYERKRYTITSVIFTTALQNLHTDPTRLLEHAIFKYTISNVFNMNELYFIWIDSKRVYNTYHNVMVLSHSPKRLKSNVLGWTSFS